MRNPYGSGSDLPGGGEARGKAGGREGGGERGRGGGGRVGWRRGAKKHVAEENNNLLKKGFY